MSQYPSPYSPPPDPQQFGYTQGNYGNYGPNPYEAELLSPARRAGLMMSILGGLMLLAGTCCVGAAWIAPWDEVFSQRPELTQQLQIPNMSPTEAIRMLMTIVGVLGLLAGLAQLIVGLFVRRGGLGAAVGGIVIACLVLLYPILSLIAVPFTIGRQPPVELAGTVCFNVFLLALYGMLLAWLILAARATDRIREWRASYQAQYAQYQTQYRAYQQAYAQQSYGGYPPPQQQPPPAPPPPPPVEPPPPPRP